MPKEIEHPTLDPSKFLNTPLRLQNIKRDHFDYALRNILNLDDEAIKKIRKEGMVFGPEC